MANRLCLIAKIGACCIIVQPSITWKRVVVKYIKHLPKDNLSRCEEVKKQGWSELKEPNIPVSLLLSIPFACLSVYLGIVAFPQIHDYLKEVLLIFTSDDEFDLVINLQYVIALYGYVILHELIHVIFMPNFLKSNKTVFSIQLWGGFASTEEIMSKARFIAISLMPYLILTFVLPALLIYMKLPISLITLLALINASGSCLDMLGIALICLQVPNGAKIRNVGMKTFYKI